MPTILQRAVYGAVVLWETCKDDFQEERVSKFSSHADDSSEIELAKKKKKKNGYWVW